MTGGWLYKRTELELWTVGFYAPDGKWEPQEDFGSSDEAAARVHWLNGGGTSPVSAMTDRDFELLWDQATNWRGVDRPSDRFEPIYRGETVSYHWDNAYWFEEWPNVLLATWYLASKGAKFQVLSDEYVDDDDNVGGFVVVTDYGERLG